MALKTKKQPRDQQKKPKNSRDSIAGKTDAQTFTHHIKELRRRLALSVLAGIIIGGVVYYYHDFFVRIIMTPLGGQKLIYLTPGGGFSFIFMVTFYVTLLFALPFILYQLYAFLRPAMPVHAGKKSFIVGLSALVLMAAGATFGYMYAVPAGLNFLSNFANEYLTASLTADSYLTFVLGYIVGIGALFELPLLLLFWHWIHPLTPKKLLSSERYVIVGAFIAAAMLSPSPDALSQTIIAVPIIITYQFGVIIALLSIRKARKLEKRLVVAQEKVVLSTPIEQNEPIVVASKPQTIAPVPVPAQLAPRPRVASVDGMIARQKAPNLQSSKLAMPPAGSMVRSQPPLMVPRRTRTISDFGPVRNSVIDMG